MLTLTAKARGGMAPELKVDVATLDDAGPALRVWIERYWLGASHCGDMPGTVRDGKRIVARVSYNGRLWSADGRTPLAGRKVNA